MKVAHENIRRMTSRGWRANIILTLCFLATLTLLHLTMIGEPQSAEALKAVLYPTYRPKAYEIHMVYIPKGHGLIE
jgi:hypothetical protein